MMYVSSKQFKLVANTAPPTQLQTWNSTTTYALGDKVRYGNYIYESLSADNINNQPDVSALKWYAEAPVNEYAMFDGFNSTQTVSSNDIVISMDVSDVDTIGIFRVVAKEISITMTDNVTGNVIYDKTHNMQSYNITDWWENMFDNGDNISKLIVQTIPSYDCRLEIVIRADVDGVMVGNIVIGLSKSVGCTLIDAKVSVRSTATKDRRSDGRMVVSKGSGYERFTVPVLIDTNSFDTVVERLKSVDSVPTLFVADERDGGVGALSVFGFYRDFELAFGLNKSKYTIEIEGVG